MYNFVKVLSDSVKVGNSFIISGTSSSGAENVTVSFSSGTTADADKAVSIDLNFSSSKVIINKGVEKDVAVERGTKFEFQISVEDDAFQISLNGESVGEYKLQIDQIRSVIVNGDVDKLLKVNHLNAEFPTVAEYEENSAFESYIPVKFQPGHVIAVSGNCTDEFFFMFTKNGTNRQMIHFNPRFDEEVVVMNTEDDVDAWTENEVRSSEFPFEIEKPFKIAFGFTGEVLKIAVNGSNLMEFNLDCVLLEEGESIWDVLSGFRVVNRNEDGVTTISRVEHYKVDENVEGFEKYSTLD